MNEQNFNILFTSDGNIGGKMPWKLAPGNLPEKAMFKLHNLQINATGRNKKVTRFQSSLQDALSHNASIILHVIFYAEIIQV